MTTLIFLLTVLTLSTLMLLVAGKSMGVKSFKKVAKLGIFIVAAYSSIWLWFFLTKVNHHVPLGTDVCFDAWCATVSGVDRQPSASGDSVTIVLSVRIANHPPGIVGKPSEPRIELIDGRGHRWRAIATEGIPLDTQLAVNEIKETKLVFMLPVTARRLVAQIEEGPWMTALVFPQDEVLIDLP